MDDESQPYDVLRCCMDKGWLLKSSCESMEFKGMTYVLEALDGKEFIVTVEEVKDE